VEDANRGHPDVGFEAYAAARGLQFYGQAVMGAFCGVLPTWPDYTFNVMRGILPGGGYGILEHELEEIGIADNGNFERGGTFWGTRAIGRSSGGGGIKGVVNFFSPIQIFDVKPPNEPFATSAAWAPTTRVVVRVPEAALLPRMLIRRSDWFPSLGNPRLDEHGLPGYRIMRDDLPDDLLTSIFSGPFGQVLAGAPYPMVEVELSHGAVTFQRNGYAKTDEDMDALAHAGCALASALRQVAAPLLAPQPFTTQLGPPAPESAPVPWYRYAVAEWAQALPLVAAERAMVLEDPVAYHQAFPTLPVPGTAMGVMRGTVPGSDRFGRLAFHQQGGHTSSTVRGALLLEAGPAAPTFEPGGTLVKETDMYVEVVDGIAALWNRVRTADGYHSAALVENGLRTAALVGV